MIQVLVQQGQTLLIQGSTDVVSGFYHMLELGLAAAGAAFGFAAGRF